MNFPFVARQLGFVAWLIGFAMVASLPWAHPALGKSDAVEERGLMALLFSIAICVGTGVILRRIGRGARVTLYRKEAMAVVGLSWILATVLGALPYLFSGTQRGWAEPPTQEQAGVPLDVPLVEQIADWLFESQSGFSTTGATVLTAIEDKQLVPRCILFWRSTTHFLGGLGIIVLFVAVLGQGSARKALMRAEMPGPSKEGAQARMQHTALWFAGIYCVLNLLLAIILKMQGMTWFDAFCHAFGTMATGGFSTKDSSLGWYDSAAIEYTVTLFMILAGTNFTLLYLVLMRGPQCLWKDTEWRVYMAIIFVVTAVIVCLGAGYYQDFDESGRLSWSGELSLAIRYGLFQVVSIVTTTGFGTDDFNDWNQAARCSLFVLMFVGGCAGSTGGGMKVIRHVLFAKILRIELEKAFHPTLVRPLRIGGQPIPDPDLYKNILVYFGLVLGVFVASWLLVVAIEPDSTWIDAGKPIEDKLIDSASAVVATLNNIGPGLGLVGATENYAGFHWATKLLFVLLMMLGRLEFFSILVLLVPSFWRRPV